MTKAKSDAFHSHCVRRGWDKPRIGGWKTKVGTLPLAGACLSLLLLGGRLQEGTGEDELADAEGASWNSGPSGSS